VERKGLQELNWIRNNPALAALVGFLVLLLAWVVVRGILILTGAGTDVDGTVSSLP
jgi:hypothetical protein